MHMCCAVLIPAVAMMRMLDAALRCADPCCAVPAALGSPCCALMLPPVLHHAVQPPP